MRYHQTDETDATAKLQRRHSKHGSGEIQSCLPATNRHPQCRRFVQSARQHIQPTGQHRDAQPHCQQHEPGKKQALRMR